MRRYGWRAAVGWAATMATALAASTMLGGCVSTVASVVKAPFQVAGQTADWMTTSQDEADRNYGRRMRKKEAREGRERRRQDREREREARRDRD